MNVKKLFIRGLLWMAGFAVWTFLIQTVDVQPFGVNDSKIGFATLNCWFHELTGVHMELYELTDWLGLVPVLVCVIFGVVGMVQLVKRRNFYKVDFDILLLGGYYIFVVAAYLVFEIIPLNYRPVLIDGFMESSYPSSTTLLVLSVMPTLNYQVNRRMKNVGMKRIIGILTYGFSVAMVSGRMISGVHWFTDIVGAVLFSTGLYCLYKAVIGFWDQEK